MSIRKFCGFQRLCQAKAVVQRNQIEQKAAFALVSLISNSTHSTLRPPFDQCSQATAMSALPNLQRQTSTKRHTLRRNNHEVHSQLTPTRPFNSIRCLPEPSGWTI